MYSFCTEKEGNLRLRVYYRPLNAVTVWDSRPVPRMNKCIDSVGKAMMFFTLDAKSDHRKGEEGKKDVVKMAFVAHNELCEYTKMPSDCFKRYVNGSKSSGRNIGYYKMAVCSCPY